MLIHFSCNYSINLRNIKISKEEGGEAVSAASAPAVGSTSVFALCPGYFIPLCTESGQAGPM